MNKRIFGIKISTILQAFVCVLFALVLWLAVKYNNTEEAETAVLPTTEAVCSSIEVL